jgi:non-specific serine/threonine protein kinase
LRLAGAAAALREQAGTPLTVAYHRRLDVELEPARRALGRLAGASLAEGRTLSLEGAIAEAVATAPPEPTQRRQPDGGPLSAREREVAALISRGYSNHRIATHLVVSESTVATHVQHILGKLDLGSRAQVAVWGVQNGLLDNNQLPAPRQPASSQSP